MLEIKSESSNYFKLRNKIALSESNPFSKIVKEKIQNSENTLMNLGVGFNGKELQNEFFKQYSEEIVKNILEIRFNGCKIHHKLIYQSIIELLSIEARVILP